MAAGPGWRPHLSSQRREGEPGPHGTRHQEPGRPGGRICRQGPAGRHRARPPRVRWERLDLLQRRRGRRPGRHGKEARRHDRRKVQGGAAGHRPPAPRDLSVPREGADALRAARRHVLPQPEAVQKLVREKGLFSFYRDGHKECCGVRKVEPLVRALKPLAAWITGQRKDQSPGTRAEVPVVQLDPTFGSPERPLVKFNPLANWTSKQVWAYIREHDVPYNALHDRGFVSIGCEPCTRPTNPGEHERAGRWWWEEETMKECGLHAGNVK